MTTRPGRSQRGATVVEFALIALFYFFTLLFGIMEMGRAFFYYNGAAEATRLGARLAVVCTQSTGQQEIIKARMRQFVSILDDEHIAFEYLPNDGCAATGTCQSVTVRILPGITFDTVIPFVPLKWPLPAFATTLPTESLDSTNNPVCNPL